MPKYKKDQKKPSKSKNDSKDAFLLRSIRISAILGGFFLDAHNPIYSSYMKRLFV